MSNNKGISPSAIEDLKFILKVHKTKIYDILNYIASTKNYKGISLIPLSQNIEEKFDLDDETSFAITSFIYNLPIINSNKKIYDSFMKFLEIQFPEKKDDILQIITKIKELQILDEIYKHKAYTKIENAGIPHLYALSYTIDYRILNLDKTKEIVPSVICNILTHDNLDDESDELKTKTITFQFSPNALDKIIVELQTIKNKLEKELQLIAIKQ